MTCVRESNIFKNSIPKKDDTKLIEKGVDEKGRNYEIYSTSRSINSIYLEKFEQNSPIYLMADCEFEPIWNEKKDAVKKRAEFYNKLRDKWKAFGNLWVGEIKSEPILFDINQAERNLEN